MEQLIVKQLEDYRKSVKFSVKKNIEGKGLTYDDEIRKDCHQDMILDILVKYRKGEYKIQYNPQSGKIYIKSKSFAGELKPFACSVARGKYWNYLKKNNKIPVIDIEQEGVHEYVEKDYLRNPSSVAIENIWFTLYLRTSYTARQRQVVRKLLDGYNQTEIARHYKISQPAIHKTVKQIAKKLQEDITI